MLGRRLKNMREDNYMTRDDLAGRLNVSLHAVAKYERDEREPNDALKMEIARIFNVSLDFLVGLCEHKYSYSRDNLVLVPYVLDDDEMNQIQDYADMVAHLRKAKRRQFAASANNIFKKMFSD
ncbi:MAG: helix-turn-helix domain-containing protein [Oscillospiraceae bacterium]|nr:helix-turn-helix domain-containing protein [Oscillospiraceae bacterium]